MAKILELYQPDIQEKMSETTINARMDKDGTIIEVLSDGSERPFPQAKSMPKMTEEAVLAAALADPDAQPLTTEDLTRMKSTPRIKIIRRALQLSAEELSACYHIPLDVLKDWEQGHSQPDQTAIAYLRVIASIPQAIKDALQR